MYDVIIIGSGITGSFIAHYLSNYQLKVLMLEKDIEVSNGVTKANSAIIHSGYDPKPGTLKAKLNVLGNKMYKEITKALNVPYKEIGSYTLAFDEEEELELRKLYHQGIENGVETYLFEKKELLKVEPNIKETVRLGLYAPTTGILAPWDMVYALLENAIYNGLELKTSQEVMSIQKEQDTFNVYTKDNTYTTRYVINAAGLYAHKISRMVTDDPGYEMIYTRGQYYVLDRGHEDYCKHVIYPTPTSKGKGVLVVPTIHGNILLGPTSEEIEVPNATEVTKDGLNYVRKHIDYMMNHTPYKAIIRSFSGIRPKTTRGDFIIEEIKDVKNFIQVAGIESPGLASSPAIGQMVLDILLSKEKFNIKDKYRLKPQKYEKVSEKPIDEINTLIQQNPSYGKIICRCESISEGEIIDAIKGPLGAKTVDGVKRRARPGAGRCQGGFCQPLIVNIIAKKFNMNRKDVLMDNEGSNILFKETKVNGGEGNE